MERIRNNTRRFHGLSSSFRFLELRKIIPNIVTLAALCVGLTGLRWALLGNFEKSISFVLIACVLDGLDGRVARFLKGDTRFGAEFDSLCDFVNFGVVPGLIMYLWALNLRGRIGWVALLIYVVACGLRLARFNVALEHISHKPAWVHRYFFGAPAPIGAILLLFPFYITFIFRWNMSGNFFLSTTVGNLLIVFYTILIGLFMISSVPTLSIKHMSLPIRKSLIVPTLILFIIFIEIISLYFWLCMVILCILYFMTVPFTCMQYVKRLRMQKIYKR